MVSVIISDKKKIQKIYEASKKLLQPFKEKIKDNPRNCIKIML